MSGHPSYWIEWLFNHPPFLALAFAAQAALGFYILALMSGWNRLSKRFRNKETFYGETWSFQSARMRSLISFGSALTMGADESGLYMAVFPLFRLCHPPLLIPWSEVSIIPGERGLIFKKRLLLLGRREAISLSISSSLAQNLKEAAGNAWPVETFA